MPLKPRTGSVGSALTFDDLDARLDELVPFDVTDYGAVGDGVTDDKAAIQAAIDAAEPVRGIVFFPYSTDEYMVFKAPASALLCPNTRGRFSSICRSRAMPGGTQLRAA